MKRDKERERKLNAHDTGERDKTGYMHVFSKRRRTHYNNTYPYDERISYTYTSRAHAHDAPISDRTIDR